MPDAGPAGASSFEAMDLRHDLRASLEELKEQIAAASGNESRRINYVWRAVIKTATALSMVARALSPVYSRPSHHPDRSPAVCQSQSIPHRHDTV
jgi:hypothetical protein